MPDLHSIKTDKVARGVWRFLLNVEKKLRDCFMFTFDVLSLVESL